MARNDQPYVEHIATAFRTLAQNRVPAGYGLRKVGRSERIACRQLGLSVTTAQVLEGRGLRILAARARYRGKHPIVLEEHRCSADAGSVVAAVAAMGIGHVVRPDGRPIVTRQSLEMSVSGSAHDRSAEPDFSSLINGTLRP